MTKSERFEAIRERARAAIRDLYHNATPSYPRINHDETGERFQSWFQSTAEFEIDYLSSGGAYGTNYRKTLSADCNAGRYKSQAARDYYVAKGMRAMRMERADCGMLTGWRALEIAAGNERVRSLLAKHGAVRRNDALWERITEYGKLYQYGRGGRTLAPEGLMRRESVNEDYCDDMPIEKVVELIRIVESFNRYVEDWCKSIPQQWKDYCAEERFNRRYEQARARNAARIEKAEREYWAARDVVTV